MPNFNPQSYWDSRHSEHYGPESVGYAGLGVPFNEWMYRVRAHVVAREVRAARIDLSSHDVLDVGCGTGFYIRLWKHLGAQSVAGADFAPYAVRSLRERFPEHRFFELDVACDELPPELGQFGLVSAFDILYHIVDDAKYAQAFRNIRSLVRPGGYFIFSENFLPVERESKEHQVSRSCAEIHALLAENEFSVVRRAPVFFLMNRPLKSTNPLLRASWRVIERVTSIPDRPYLGHLLGATLYPIEISTLRVVRRGPTTEMVICRRGMS